MRASGRRKSCPVAVVPYRAYGLGVLPLPAGEGWGEGIRLLRSMSRFVIVFFLFRFISKNSFPSPPAGVMVG